MEKQRRQKFLDAMNSYDEKLDESGAKSPAQAKKAGPQDCPVQWRREGSEVHTDVKIVYVNELEPHTGLTA